MEKGEKKVAEINCLPQVLVVDDEALNIEVISCMLEEKGYPCDSANNGFEALD